MMDFGTSYLSNCFIRGSLVHTCQGGGCVGPYNGNHYPSRRVRHGVDKRWEGNVVEIRGNGVYGAIGVACQWYVCS